jgi:5,10-methylenetetrahydromethanopterin reductase
VTKFKQNSRLKARIQKMINLGINIIPVMSVNEIIELIQAAEDIGYKYCLVADEGMTPDVYVTLGAAAKVTNQIILGPVTNGYTRHPAVTAVATATLNQLSDGRAILVMVAGGSIVLDTFKISRESPLAVVRDSIDICRKLWSGEIINYEGAKFSLNNARLEVGPQNIPIWIAARGKQMLKLSGQMADGILLMVKSDIGPAIDIVNQYDNNPSRVYMDRIAYTEQMIDDATRLFPYVLKDTPERQLSGFLEENEIKQLKQALETGGTDAVAKLITKDIIKRYKVAGTPDECKKTLNKLIRDHNLDTFMLNITSAGLKQNIQMLEDVYTIMQD